ncbi:miro-like family protein [Candidatus Erwinia dacicola]|uniref:ATP-binding protein Uup n=1 Tax=Candidatus Erwinia dacicola TaxID=252393 RepID=A0A328TSG2_9GAMM|nr:miro-like family protein [Candidatus Erwinia dacicola]
MSLISIHGAYLSFSDAPLLDNTELHIEENERVCLVGRNGTGKSALMKIINCEQPLDDGRIIYEQDLVMARLQQDLPRKVPGSVYDFVAEGVEEQAEHLKAYYAISHKVMEDPSNKNLNEMARLQGILDYKNLWQLESRIHDVQQQIGLDGETQLSSLSGGWLREAALGRALVSNPKVLMLDEPTNHLDIETIDWLEGFLKTFQGSIIFISHDRSFIRNMATRIVDLYRGKLVSWSGDYDLYLTSKEEALRVEEMQNAEFDRKLAQEEVWIRQGIKARRMRNKGRVRALKALRSECSDRREVMGKANMPVEEASRSGKIVFKLENVNYSVASKQLVRDFSRQVQRGDKIALIGSNGCGKTTLLKLMLDQLKADSDRVHIGTKLEVAYFDQHRAELDLDRTVIDNLVEGKQEVMVNGKPRHVLGYLQEFLFYPKRAMTPVRALSGGERNRLLLSRLFLKPSNLLILDEPINDLDVETLELLEELVDGYESTVLLVSHDRQFVDNTVTECWIFEGNGEIGAFVGGYHDAQLQRKAFKQNRVSAKPTSAQPRQKIAKSEAAKKPAAKPSYNLQQELEQLPKQIEALEARLGCTRFRLPTATSSLSRVR